MKPFFFSCLRCSGLEDIDTQTSCSQTKARRTDQTNGIWTQHQHLVSVGEIIKSVSEFKNIMAEY